MAFAQTQCYLQRIKQTFSMTFSQSIILDFILYLRQNGVEIVKGSYGVAHLIFYLWKINVVSLLKMSECEESLWPVSRI